MNNLDMHHRDKNDTINDLREKVIDILAFYDSQNIRIEINCDIPKKSVRISITEINI